MDTLSKDVRYGFRSLLKRPASAVIAVITPALEIGAHTAILQHHQRTVTEAPAIFRSRSHRRLVRMMLGFQISNVRFEI